MISRPTLVIRIAALVLIAAALVLASVVDASARPGWGRCRTERPGRGVCQIVAHVRDVTRDYTPPETDPIPRDWIWRLPGGK